MQQRFSPTTGFLFIVTLFVMVCTWSSYGQVSTLSAWTNRYNNTGNLSVAVTVPTGTNSYRMLVVAVATSQTATGNARTVVVTYGGQTLSLAAGDLSSTTVRQHTAIFYLNEAGLDAATSTTLTATFSGGTTRINTVWSAVFDYVDQTSAPVNFQNYNNTTAVTTFSFATGLTVTENDLAIKVVSSLRSGNNNPRTLSNFGTDWTASNQQTWTTTDGVRNIVGNRAFNTTSTPVADVSTTTMSGSSLPSMTGVSLKSLPKQFRSLATGTWGTTTTWQQSMNLGSSWAAATTTPTSSDLGVTVLNTHTVSLNGAATASSITIDAGGTLSTGATNTWTLAVTGTTSVAGTLTLSNTGTKTFTGGVTIASGGVWNETSAATILVGGSWSNSGTLTAIGTTSFTGGTTATLSGASTFTNLTVNKSGGSLTASGTLVVTGLTHVVAGTLTSATDYNNVTIESGATLASSTGGTINVSGTWSNDGTFTANEGTVNFNGSSAQSIEGASTTTFYTLKISNAAGVTGNSDILVSHDLILNAANPSITKGCLDMPYSSSSSYTELFMGATATTTNSVAAADVTGVVTRTSFAAATPYSYGNQYTTLNMNNSGVGALLPSSLSIKIVLTNSDLSWQSNAIHRYYTIIQTGGNNISLVTENLHYQESELAAGTTETSLVLYDYHYVAPPGSSFSHEHTKSSVDYTNNWVGLGNLSLSYLAPTSVFGAEEKSWTLAPSTAGAKTWFGGTDSDWEKNDNWTGGIPTSTDNVVIPDATTTSNDPTLPTSASVKTITIYANGILNGGSGTLTLSGSNGAWLNLGTFNPGTSTIQFSNAAATMADVPPPYTSFYNLTILDNAKLTFGTGSYIKVLNTLSLSSNGILDAASNENTVEYGGTGSQTIINPNATPSGYHNLTISGGGTKTFPSSLNIRGDFENNNGTTSLTELVFNGPYNMMQNLKGTNNTSFTTLTINNGIGVLISEPATTVSSNLNVTSGVLTLDAGKFLTCSGTTTLSNANSFVIQSDATGTGSFIDNGSGSVVGSGASSVKVERYISNSPWRWHFLSSPVAAQALWPQFAPTPTTGSSYLDYAWGNNCKWDLYYFNPSNATDGTWVNIRQSGDAGMYNYSGFGATNNPTMESGKGYLVSYTTGWKDGNPETHEFTGTLTTGTTNITIANTISPYNLVGNPYPSAIDWKSASGWTRADLNPSGSGFDYWIFNDAAGNYGVCNSVDDAGTLSTTRYIAPMQSFFVRAKVGVSSGTLGLTNDTRFHNNQTWLKQTSGDPDNTLRLSLTTNANSYFDETIIQVNSQFENSASTKYWSLYQDAPELYSIQAEAKNSILKLNSIGEGITIPIGIKASINATFTLKNSSNADFPLCGSIILEDLKTGSTQDLKINPNYTFTTQSGDDPKRFLLHFNKSIGINESNLGSQALIYAVDQSVYIKTENAESRGAQLGIYNLLGQCVYSNTLQSNFQRIDLQVPAGLYVVTYWTENSKTSTKIILN